MRRPPGIVINSIHHEIQESHGDNPLDFPDIQAIEQVYASSAQVHRKDHEGYISAFFCPKLESKPTDERKEAHRLLPLEIMVKIIDECQQAGYENRDILILFRNNASGKEIAEYLLKMDTEGSGKYRFTSQESLSVGNSASVSLIISLLTYVSGKDKAISLAEMIHFSHLAGINEEILLSMVEGENIVQAE